MEQYSGYLADDESFRRPQDRNAHAGLRRNLYDWRSMLRPPSRCQFRNQPSPASTQTFSSVPQANQGKRKHHQTSSSGGSSSNNDGRPSHLANEFSEFVDFLADEEVLDSLQLIVEDAVKKLRDVTTQKGEPVFDIQEDSPSSVDSESWTYSHSSTYSQTKYQTTTTSSSDNDQEKSFTSGGESKPSGKICLLDKYVAKLPRLGTTTTEETSGGIHTETFSEQSGDSFFQREHLHIWAKLAESFEPPRRDHFAKLRKGRPEESFSLESLHKEVTSVLKRPVPRCIPLYYTCQQPFQALDFLEENQILAALQDIINQAVLKILEATMTDGIPFLSIFDERAYPMLSMDSTEEELDSGSEGSGSGEETSEEGDSKSEGKSAEEKDKKKKKKGKGKKEESLMGDEKGRPKYTPPPLPKSKRKSITSEEPSRKAKYTPPHLPKTKPRAAHEEHPPKPKYVPPPLPKPRQKKPDASQTETETTKSTILTRQIVTSKKIKQPRPLPKQSIIDFLIENAAKLILYKYNYETLLSEKLGFISVPVTKVLLEIMYGYKKVKGSGIRLSSQIDWTKVYDEIYKKRPPKPKAPKQDDEKKKKKKGGDKKKQKAGEKKKPDEKKTGLFKPPKMPKGKVVVMKLPSEDTKSKKGEGLASITEQKEPEIFEIIPPQFPTDAEPDSGNEDDFIQPSSSKPSASTTPDSVKTSTRTKPKKPAPPLEVSSSATGTQKYSRSSRKSSVASQTNQGSTVLLPEMDVASQVSEAQVKRSVYHRSSFSEEGSKTVLPKI